ncbi:hypothetical protein BKA64DRAFT_742170 [Cadophora sp. MPI-SDFR-AT-0126]|nr:hypothetical protein BKA64DRAFT_742170 [Leotiomycetes sp. MPI-SDFR-AT-0126]
MTTPTTVFEFVMADPVKNPKPGKSLQIRRHCMQGRNTREGSRRMQQGQRKRPIKDEENALGVQRALRPNKSLVSEMPPPESLICDLALLRFAGPGIDSKARAPLFKAFAYSFANQALSPLDRCVEFDCLDSDSFELFLSDNAFLHSVMCASFAINDILNSQWNGKPGPQTLFHLRNALSLLQEKLRDRNVHQDESVLQVVLNLALLSGAFGEWPAAGTHFKGLHKLVQMRGHLEFLKGRPKLHFKLDRIDLARTLTTGRRPLFLDPAVSWAPIIPAPYSTLPVELYQPSPNWHPRLVNIFRDFQYLCVEINSDAMRHLPHNATYLQSVLTSLQSRLLHLGDLPVDPPMEKLVRLTMLCLLTTTSKTAGRKLPYDWVIKQVRDAYTKAARQLLQEDICLRVWLVMTVAFTVANPQKEWVREEWEKIDLGLDRNWASVKNHLMHVTWIESIHDRPGELVFKQLEESSFLKN